YVTTEPSNSLDRPRRAPPVPGSSWMPTRAAASAHWLLRCSVGVTTMTRLTMRLLSRWWATRSAKVVLPAPGVATHRKSLGASDVYRSKASRCHARRLDAVPHGARSGYAGGRESKGEVRMRDGTLLARTARRRERSSLGRVERFVPFFHPEE